MSDDFILQKLGGSVVKTTKLDNLYHVPYSDGVDPDSVDLPDYNDPVMPDGVFVVGN